jgi:hypothetical protein
MIFKRKKNEIKTQKILSQDFLRRIKKQFSAILKLTDKKVSSSQFTLCFIRKKKQ